MTRPRLAVPGLLLAGALLLTAAPAHAQSGWGLRTGYSVDPDQFYVGAHAGVGPLVGNLWLRPNLEIGFGDDVTVISINAELAYWFPTKSAWRLYLGGGPGLNIFDYDSGSETRGGLNLLFGVGHRGGFFGEVKAGLFDSPEFKIGFGYTF
jgi:hypothetical protein